MRALASLLITGLFCLSAASARAASGYGEDALTLWALKNKLRDILKELGDESDPEKCTVIYRPSFGRSGGDKSSQFGEFDFIILAENRLYLGESKWDSSSAKVKEGRIELEQRQLDRHVIFKRYIEQWLVCGTTDWDEFVEVNHGAIKITEEFSKPMPPKESNKAAVLEDTVGTFSVT